MPIISNFPGGAAVDTTLSVSGKAADAATVGSRLSAINTEISALGTSTTAASTAAEMTDISKIYVYIGSEDGYTNGNWYYYDGSAWVSGGVFNAVTVETDSTLTLSNHAADAKAVGDAIRDLEEQIQSMSSIDWVQPEADETYSVVVPGTIALSPSNLALESGESATITVSYDASEFPNPTFTWRSSDTSVATVANGVVTWAGEGTATITCTMVEDTDVRATCSVTCAAFEARYVTTGLEIQLDAIQTTTKPWVDVSGNGYTIACPNSGGWTSYGTYNNTNSRAQAKCVDATLLGLLTSGFTAEVIFQRRYYNANNAATDFTDTKMPLFNVGNGDNNYLIVPTGQMRVPGATTLYGTALTDYDTIMHYTVAYDPAAAKMYLYHEGELDATADASAIVITGLGKIEFFGNQDWANALLGSFNGARLYSRCLSAAEIAANYQTDLYRYGTVNIATEG